MIIAFQRIMGRHQWWLWLILLVVIVLVFVFMDSWGLSGANRGGVGSSGSMVYGRTVSPGELDLAMRRLRVKEQLSRQPRRKDEKEADRMRHEVLRTMALVDKAGQMGITTGEKEVVETIRHLPHFATNGQFDDSRYEEFVRESLGRMGLTDVAFAKMVQDELTIGKLRRLVASTAKVTPSLVAEKVSQITDRVTASAFRFDKAAYLAQVKPTDAELKAYYEKNPDDFRTLERTRVAYVAFPVDPSRAPTDAEIQPQELEAAYQASIGAFLGKDGKPKPPTDKGVEAALKKMIREMRAVEATAIEAADFARLVTEPGKTPTAFDNSARDRNLAVKETDFFDIEHPPQGIASPQFLRAALELDMERPISDIVRSPTAVYVLKFLQRTPSEVIPFEKVRDSVKAGYIGATALSLARADGQKKHDELEALLASGKPFAPACAELKLKPHAFKNFAGSDETRPADPFDGGVRYVAIMLPTGAMSRFYPSAEGGFFVYVNDRGLGKPEDATKVEAPVFRQLMEERQAQMIFDFENAVLAEAGLKDLSAPPSRIEEE